MRCEARTTRGTQCRATKDLIYRTHEGKEYLCCKRHDNEFFCPKTRKARNCLPRSPQPEDKIFSRGYVIGGLNKAR